MTILILFIKYVCLKSNKYLTNISYTYTKPIFQGRTPAELTPASRLKGAVGSCGNDYFTGIF